MTLRHLSHADKERTTEKLGTLLPQRSEVVFACLHGSFLLPDAGFHDIDIGVWVESDVVGPDRALEYSWQLSSWLEQDVPHPVDVKVLNYATIGFRHAASGGLLLAAKGAQQWYDFRERTWREYLDFAPIARQSLLDLLGTSTQ